MTSLKNVLAILVLSLLASCTSEVPMQGHALRVFAVDNEGVKWITQDDVQRAEKSGVRDGQAYIRLHLKPDAAQRLMALTSANIGKLTRFTWGKTVSQMSVQAAFGQVVELPAPPL
jgi:hypothetical protein